MASPPSKSGRIELRADRVSERRIRLAASLKRQSVSSFMLEAASDRAEQVIAEVREVVVPASYFDAIWKSLSVAPKPNARLRKLARRPRRFVQR